MEEEKLKNIIVEQAKFFLSEVGEFYPFGAMVNADGSIVPLGVQLENDYPNLMEVILVLEEAIIDKLKNREAKIGGIGTDVNYKPINETEKRSAIQIRILQVNGESKDFYLTYSNVNGKFIYEEIFSETGTLNFLKVN
jgi:hypothetical protein